ncbi:MAG: hypothetical protein ACOYOI_08975 [Chthoniobacterales bacterium]
MSTTIYVSTIIPALFAVGRQYVDVPSLKQVRAGLHEAFGKVQTAQNLEYVHIDITSSAIGDMLESNGSLCSEADDIYFRTEGQMPHVFTQGYVEQIIAWGVPKALREAFWEVMGKNAVDTLSETVPILERRIEQNIALARRYCQQCADNNSLMLQLDSGDYYHKGWSDRGYDWQNRILCRAQPERKREDELKKKLEQMKV